MTPTIRSFNGFYRILSLITALLCLNGCGYVSLDSPLKTKADTSSRFANIVESSDQGSYNMGQWWTRINDPFLNQAVETLLNENLSLIEGSERVIQAREAVNMSRGSFLPTLGANASASRSFQNSGAASAGLGGAGFGGQRTYFNNYDANVSSAWEIDVFGRLRSTLNASKTTYQSAEYDREALAHSLISTLVNLRVEIAVYKNLLDLAQQQANNREQLYEIVQRRYNLGTEGATLSDVYLAENNFKSASSDINEYNRLLQDALYRLDILLGQTPGTTSLDDDRFSMILPPMDVAVCVPAKLLDRRPDLKASALRVRAAQANINVAVANLYPSLNLSGNLGFTGTQTSNLFSSQQLAGSILGSITSSLFEGGRLRANIRMQESEARELAASYADDVLTAMKDVESQLYAEAQLKQELTHLSEAADALRNAEDSAEERYIRGIETLQNFLDIQQNRYLTQQTLLVAQQTKWSTRVALYLALGGDWLSKPARASEDCASQPQNLRSNDQGEAPAPKAAPLTNEQEQTTQPIYIDIIEDIRL